MNKRFKFTNANLKSLPANTSNNKTTELEFSDTECIGLKLLSGRSGSKHFLLRYTLEGRKRTPYLSTSTAGTYQLGEQY